MANCWTIFLSTQGKNIIFLHTERNYSTMPTISEPSSGGDSVNILIPPEIRGLIDRAAALSGTDRTDFILAAARAAAEEKLVDQREIRVSQKAYAQFLSRLDQPPRFNKRIRQTMNASVPWEEA